MISEIVVPQSGKSVDSTALKSQINRTPFTTDEMLIICTNAFTLTLPRINIYHVANNIICEGQP